MSTSTPSGFGQFVPGFEFMQNLARQATSGLAQGVQQAVPQMPVDVQALGADLVAFTGITGPLTSALTQIASLGPGIKALVGFVGFVVALISLAALRNFGPVLFYVGLAIFAVLVQHHALTAFEVLAGARCFNLVCDKLKITIPWRNALYAGG